MKALLAISMFLFAQVVISGGPSTLPVTIKGHIKPNPSDPAWDVKHLHVYVKGNNKILGKAITNNHGDFKLTFTPKDEKTFDFYCTADNSATLLIASITTFESDTPEMFFYVPIKLQLNNKGQVICPKCKKVDKVFKIIFSHPPGYDDLVKKGVIDTTIHHQGIYYCSRDNLSF
jgi:hypothetical protein